jgi:hypothetical protein
MRVVALLATLLLSGCASMTTAEKWAIGVAAADVATTAAGLNRNLEEQNPLLRGGSDGETIARAIVFNAALYWLAHKVINRYTTAMQTKYWRLVVGLRSPVVGWNVYQIVENEK